MTAEAHHVSSFASARTKPAYITGIMVVKHCHNSDITFLAEKWEISPQ